MWMQYLTNAVREVTRGEESGEVQEEGEAYESWHAGYHVWRRCLVERRLVHPRSRGVILHFFNDAEQASGV